jgi:hypothetical protein
MHITLGAAVLIVGLLYLLTIPAGRKVLAALALIGGGVFAWLVQQENASADQRATKEAYLITHYAEMHARCDKKYPDPLSHGANSFEWRWWSDCMSGKGEDLSKEIDSWRATIKGDPMAVACEEYKRPSASSRLIAPSCEGG